MVFSPLESCISGTIFGSIKPTLDAATDGDTILIMIADLHALTTTPAPEELQHNIHETARLLHAIAPQAIIFKQSDIAGHGDLAFILSAFATAEQLGRMTQFREKSSQGNPPSMALLEYPILMAADILLHQPDYLITGADQAQHLELATALCRKLNQHTGGELMMPLLQENTLRIMDLRHPNQKMSKSSSSDAGRINLLDNSDQIARKIRKAKTDAAGFQNLQTLSELFESPPATEGNYAAFKQALAQAIAEELEPIQTRYQQTEDSAIDHALNSGANYVSVSAEATLLAIKKGMGLSKDT